MESWNIEPKCTQLPVDRHSLHSSRRAIGGAPGIQAVGHRPAGGHNDAEILSEEETVNTTHLGHAFPEPQSACDHQIRGVPCAHPQCTHHTEVALENAESNEPVEMSEDPGDSAEKPEEKLVATPTRADAPRNAGRPNTRAYDDLVHLRAFRLILKQSHITARDIDCAKLIIAVGAGLIGAAAAPVVATSALGAIGFSSTGVVGGSPLTTRLSHVL